MDVKVVPTEDCARIIRNRRLIFRSLESGFKLSYRAVNNSPLVPLNDTTFNFMLYVKNPGEFLNYSNLKAHNKILTSKSVLFFKNNDVEKKKLDYSLLDDIKPHIFDYTFPFTADDPTNDKAHFEIEDFQGHSIVTIEDIVSNDHGNYEYRIDLSEQPPDKYTFKSSDINHEVVSEEIYIDKSLYRQRPLGLIQIGYTNNARSDYRLRFRRNFSKWVYHVVNRSGLSLDDHDIEILDESGDDGSGIYRTYLFTGNQATNPNDRISGYETLVFVSNKRIPFHEAPKSSLRLKKLDVTSPSNTAEVLIKNLPNADPGGIQNIKNESEIIVYI
jgi:hypothetical protein